MSYEEIEPTQENGSEKMFASVWVKVEVQDDDELTADYKDGIDCVEMDFEDAPKEKETREPKKKPVRRKEMKCEECDYRTVYKNCFKLHLLGHCNVKPYTCDLCDYSTKYPNSLQRHILLQHDCKRSDHTQDIRVYKCSDCDYTSILKWNLNAHTRKHKLDKQFKCSHCDYKTAYRHNYMKHGKVHNKKDVVFKCDKCPFTTKFEGHITRHLAQIHKEIVEKANKCRYCDFATKVKWRLNVHLKKSCKLEPLKCDYCNFETKYSCESKKHRVTHYNEIYGNYRPINMAENPEKEKMHAEVFSADDGLADIEPLESQTLHEKCNNYTLDPKREVDWNNIKVLESDNKQYPFKCILCSYVSKYKASVQRHYQRQHTGNQNRPYKCVNCDFSTKTKDQISLHNKRSQSLELIKCGKCDFTTTFKCQHIMHLKSHHKFKCNICDYSCMNKYEFQRHYASVHLGTGLRCPYCEYTATRKESLLCHQTIHTGDKPFKCQHCTYMSVRKSLLDAHMKKYHSDVTVDVQVVSARKIESLIVPESDDTSMNIDVLAEFCTQINGDERNRMSF